MADSLIRAKPIRNGLALNAKAVYASLAIITLIVAIAIQSAFNKSASPTPETAQKTPRLSGIVSQFPDSYEDIRPTPKPTPLVVYRTVIRDGEDSLSKLRAKLLAEKLERADRARTAGVSFSTVRIDETPNGIPNNSQSGSGTSDPIGTTTRDDNNRQDDKLAFLNHSRSNDTMLGNGLVDPLSPYQLMAGTIIPGVLVSGINSDLPGQILGQISQNIFDSVSGRFILLPQGTKVLGEYDSRIVYGQERVLVVWTRLILPSGKSISLEGMPGVDMSGYSGLSDQVNNHYLRLLTGVLFGSLLGAGAQIAEGPQRTTDPTYGQLALQGAARNTNEAGQEITRRNLNTQPTLEIRPGFRFSIFVTKDMVLEPVSSVDKR